jgi:hypothetical protein
MNKRSTITAILLLSTAMIACSREQADATPRHRRHSQVVYTGDLEKIPNPPGTWRIRASCAHRLKAHWNLSGELDATSVWPHRFARTYTPGPRVAIWRPGHVMGIDSCNGETCTIVDYNSDAHHGNHRYQVSISILRTKHLLDTSQDRGTTVSARSHKVRNKKERETHSHIAQVQMKLLYPNDSTLR